jgi:hypothetical protein
MNKAKKQVKTQKKQPKIKKSVKKSFKGKGNDSIQKLESQIQKIDKELKKTPVSETEKRIKLKDQKKNLESKQGLLMMRQPSGFISMGNVMNTDVYKQSYKQLQDVGKALSVAVKQFSQKPN